MRLCVAFCMLWLTGVALGHGEKSRIVCFFSSWATYRPGNGEFNVTNIDPTLCTHMIYAFVGIAENGDVNILDPWTDLPDDGGAGGFENFVALRNLSPKTKFMIGIGGWNEGSVRYSNVVGNSTLRSHFVNSIVNFTLEYGFDGFDFDWEYPAQRDGVKADVENFVLLLKELRPKFNKNNLVLSATVPAAEGSASLSYDIPGISKYLDFINLMTYDFHGASDSTAGQNTPLYPARRETSPVELSLNILASVMYWLDQGAPAKKLNLGIGFYGKSFTLNNTAENEPGSPIDRAGNAGEFTGEAGTLAYYEICEHIVNDGWTSAWDREQLVPYAYKDDQWVSYDDVRSIKKKINFIKQAGLGGAMIWSIDTDDFRGICGGVKNPLLKTLNKRLRG